MPQHLFTPSSKDATDGKPLEDDSVHRVRVVSNKVEVVRAYLPDSVSLTVASDWSAPFADKAGGGLANIAGLFGASLKTKALTAQTWQGSSPIEVSIPFVLTAENDPETDVMRPVRELMKLCLPGVSDGQRFIPPGPSFKTYLNSTGSTTEADSLRIAAAKKVSDWASFGNEAEEIVVEVGGFMIFRNVVMVSVSPVFNTQRIHHSGRPVKAEVEISFRMYTTSIKAEIDAMLGLAQAKLSILEQSGVDISKYTNKVKGKVKDLTRGLF